MKKLILLAGLYCLQPKLQAASLNPSAGLDHAVTKNGHESNRAIDRAQAHFRENFADAHHPLWSKNADNSINCYFRQQDKTFRVFYDRHGLWTYTLIGYLPGDLVNNIKYRVLENFDGYNISYVNEIQSENNEPIYIIHIENCNSIKIIRVANNDDIDVQQEFQKN